MASQNILVVLISCLGIITSVLWFQYGSSILPFFLRRSKPKPVTTETTEKRAQPVADPTGSIHISTFPPSRIEYVGGSRGIIPAQEISLSSYSGLGNSKTATGYSLPDIRSLGDFPDYARLSGIRLPNAYLEYDFNKSTPRPYRPFRWPHHQTMSLHKFEPDHWVELDRNYSRNVKKRQDLHKKYGSAVLDVASGYEYAAKELMEMIVQFICARYPHCFTLELSETREIFHNKILNTQTDLKRTEPLIVLLNNVPEDFTVMIRNDDDGQYYLRAGTVMTSFGWTVATKINKPLNEIHEHVPLYKEKMLVSMNRFFANLPTERAIQRGSWSLTPGQVLFTPPGHPRLADGSLGQQSPKLKVEDIHYRVDAQTVRRLPVSGAIVFGFRVLFTPLPALKDEPFIPKLCLKFLEEGPAELNKGTYGVEHVAIPVLKHYHEEQVKSGLVSKDWEVATLDVSPFFPGWEDKWAREQVQ